MMHHDLKELYNAVKANVDKVRCEELWQGFRLLKFALYNDTECFFDGNYVEKTDQFLANTAIEYRGEWIAIWNVSGELDPEVLASKMIHEMFHGFQNMNRDSRFPDELSALYRYQYSEENLSTKLAENRLIAELTHSFSSEKLELLLRYRKYRYEHFRYEFIYESKVEQIEGTANYVELQALKQISREKYLRKLEQMRQTITAPENLLPIRVVSYDVGALLLNMLKENDISVEQGFGDMTFSECLLADVDQVARCGADERVRQCVEDYFRRAKEKIDSAIARCAVITEQESRLLGVNVYNAVYFNGYIISTYFVMYGDEAAPTVAQGDFVIETHTEGMAARIYRLA